MKNNKITCLIYIFLFSVSNVDDMETAVANTNFNNKARKDPESINRDRTVSTNEENKIKSKVFKLN